MKVTKASILTNEVHTKEIDCTLVQMANFVAGMKVQHAFPNLSADDREFILSGITPEEWKEHLGDLIKEE